MSLLRFAFCSSLGLVLLLHGDSFAGGAVEECPASESPARFDGERSIVMVDDPHSEPIAEFTLAIWTRIDDLEKSQTFVSRAGRGSLHVRNPLSYSLDFQEGKVRAGVRNAKGRPLWAVAPAPELSKWTHLASSYDGRHLTLYVNGTRRARVKATGPIPYYQTPLFVGAFAPQLQVTQGEVGSVKLARQALTGDNIRRLFQGEELSEVDWLVALDGSELTESMKTAEPSEQQGYAIKAAGKIPTADGFRGIWYANQPSSDEYRFKYSGGLATYPHQHAPIAIYAPEANKTFFVYGGRYQQENTLLHMISYYDHATGKVARPRVLLDKKTTDAHDNPTLLIDGDGHLFVFSSAHGTSRPSYIHRSIKPYDITAFECVMETNFSYTQPWYLPEHKFVFMHTRYQKGRALFTMQSDDGVEWSEPTLLAHVAQGHYQVTWPHDNKIGSAFNYHPESLGLNWRTNLYYIETLDGGRTWQNVAGEKLDMPLTDIENLALVKEYESQKRNVYMKCVRFTSDGKPVILYLTSGGFESGPQNDPRTFCTARWTGSEWEVREATSADNNYDHASLHIAEDGTWQITGNNQAGPQRFNTGGEMAIWRSTDQGETWTLVKQLTKDSKYNHCYPRQPLHAHDDFFALWADGHGREASESRLYFTDRNGTAVWQLPYIIQGNDDMIDPIRVEGATPADE